MSGRSPRDTHDVIFRSCFRAGSDKSAPASADGYSVARTSCSLAFSNGGNVDSIAGVIRPIRLSQYLIMNSMTTAAKRYFVRGRVQGVGFRYFVERAAVELNLTGYTR